MASNVIVNIQEEVTCPICLELLAEPLSLDCGHSFCQACITANNKESVIKNQEEKGSCPVCRISYEPEHLRPNRHLANIVQRLREVDGSLEEEQKGNRCVRHGEKLLLFCQQDGRVICWLCEHSQEHRGHQTFLIEEIAHEYQEKLQGALNQLKEKLQQSGELEAGVRNRRTAWESQIQNERQHVQTEFEKLRGILDSMEQKELQKLNDEDKVILRNLAEDESELVQQSQSIKVLISDLEHRLKASFIEKLQNVSDIIQRCSNLTLKMPKTFPNQKKSVFQAPDLKRMLQVSNELEEVRSHWVDVTLNHNINEQNVQISADGRQVHFSNRFFPDVSDHSCSSYKKYSAMGSQSFTSGKYYWEVDVSEKSAWVLGVYGERHCQSNAKTLSSGFVSQSTPRKKSFSYDPFYQQKPVCNFGWVPPPRPPTSLLGVTSLQNQPTLHFWVIGFENQSVFCALEDPNSSFRIVPLPVSVLPHCVGVFLNYEMGTVSFYNITDHGSLIYKFSSCCFPERVVPYLNPRTCILPMTLCKPNS